LLNYESAHEALPGGSSYEERNVPSADRDNWQRRVVSVLPFMEQASVHQRIDLTEPFFLTSTSAALQNRKLAAETVITALVCPSDPQGDLDYSKKDPFRGASYVADGYEGQKLVVEDGSDEMTLDMDAPLKK
jgi:hypothetical protein